ncbi:hypothetical protein [Bacillus cereus group sp. BceL293]|uniref:hypothetical protein n=1 Tax=Bacillus cereus group sp. BceL293 TaxID=3444992 RepID=UPI003F297561
MGHTLTLEKVLEGKKIKIRVSINSSLTVFVGTDVGNSETAYFEMQDGQEYIRLNNILYIDDVLIDKIPITRMEKATLKHYANAEVERDEDIKEEIFNPESSIKFSYNVSKRIFEDHEEYPYHVRERIELLEKNEFDPFIHMEYWGNEAILVMVNMPYETLKKITEKRIEEKVKEAQLQKLNRKR